jgi:hypothetical protein
VCLGSKRTTANRAVNVNHLAGKPPGHDTGPKLWDRTPTCEARGRWWLSEHRAAGRRSTCAARGMVVFAQAGLDEIVTAPGLWRAIPFRSPMNVRWWPTVPPPSDEQERLNWLSAEWAIVDEWIDAQHHRDAS